jgi:hypothetical protein
MSQVRRENWAFVWKLPVTTELAWYGGKAGYNYPKYVTPLPWTADKDEVRMDVTREGTTELSLVGKVLPTSVGKPITNHGMSFMDGALVDVPVQVNPRQQGTSHSKGDCRVELGTGPIADVLRTINLGRMVMYDYVPSAQLILPAGRSVSR